MRVSHRRTCSAGLSSVREFTFTSPRRYALCTREATDYTNRAEQFQPGRQGEARMSGTVPYPRSFASAKYRRIGASSAAFVTTQVGL